MTIPEISRFLKSTWKTGLTHCLETKLEQKEWELSSYVFMAFFGLIPTIEKKTFENPAKETWNNQAGNYGRFWKEIRQFWKVLKSFLFYLSGNLILFGQSLSWSWSICMIFPSVSYVFFFFLGKSSEKSQKWTKTMTNTVLTVLSY